MKKNNNIYFNNEKGECVHLGLSEMKHESQRPRIVVTRKYTI